ncbi:MAG: ABC transporter permease [Chloroflexi bacterium]|nr:ABC transporter permease [Chloroflexota bacterium]
MSRKRTASATTVIGAVFSALLVLFLLVPVVVLLLGASPASVAAAVREDEVRRSLAVTLGGAGIATLLGLLGGVPLAWALARGRLPGKRLIEGLLGIPIIIPHTSTGVALLLTYGARGPLGKPLSQLGLFFTDRLSGVVVAMLFVSVPFLVNAARDAFAAIDADLAEAAQCDGASPWQTAWHVLLPLARRGIVGGALLMWARGISEFGAVVLLAYHPRTLAVLVYERFQGYGLVRATPLAALLIVVALVVFATAGSLLGHSPFREREL